MKIAIFSDNFYPELSGISDSIISLAKELVKFGHKICFYAPKYGADDYRAVNLPQKELNLGRDIKIVRLTSLPAPFAGAQSRLVLPLTFRWLFKNFQPDVIHSQLFGGVGLIALAAAKFYKLPLVGTNHTSITDFVAGTYIKKQSLKYSIWYYNRCDWVTAPSRSVFAEMLKHGFNKPQQVVSNPLDTKIFRPLGQSRKWKKQFNLSANTVVYVGRLSPEKNIEVIVKAAALAKKKIKDINLALAGAGKSRDELVHLSKKLGVAGEVKFFGALSHGKISELHAAAEMFAIASTSETQSLTLLQAFACGLPAVAVRARALPEYINEKNGFLVKAGQVRAMAEKFIILLSNKKLCRKLGRGAHRYVQQFSAPNIAKEWEKLYGRVIEDYKGRA